MILVNNVSEKFIIKGNQGTTCFKLNQEINILLETKVTKNADQKLLVCR